MNWKKFLIFAGITIAGAFLFAMLMETIRAKRTGFETKTLWDWMELLLIPAFLAGVAYFLNRSEKDRENEIADRRIKEDRKIADLRSILDREIATDRQQEAALQSYLDRMSELLLEKELRTKYNVEVRNVAKTRTLTVLQVLDGARKGIVIVFLKESGLIELQPIITLAETDLQHAYLGSARLARSNLAGAHLRVASLEGANLAGANLEGADLVGAELVGANLEGADLVGADLFRANLERANLAGANLFRANVSDKQLEVAYSLAKATMRDGRIHE